MIVQFDIPTFSMLLASRTLALLPPQRHSPRLSTGRSLARVIVQSQVVKAGIGDMFTKGLKSLISPEVPRETPPIDEAPEVALFFSDNAPSWENLESLLKEIGTELGDASLTQDNLLEVGPPNPASLKRTFGKSDPIRIKLYRDHAAWCPYCQKVWMQLEEKQIPYTVEKINMRCYGDKPESFYRITSSGLLPVMELDGEAMTESARIAAVLENEFPQNPLLPPKGSSELDRCDQLFALERNAFSAWLQWLCRPTFPARQKANFETVLQKVETELKHSPGPYFLGDQFSLVDIVFAPFLERMDASLAFYKGYRMRGQGKYPTLETWFDTMESRPTYLATKSDYYTHAFALPPQLGGCEMEKGGEPLAEMISGISGDTWSLPLEPLSSTSFEPYAPGDQPRHDTYYAAKKLISNREAVVKFALRGCGTEGDRPVMAPLSDPTAQSGEHARSSTDAALRHVAHALLLGVDEKQAGASKLLAQEEAGGDQLLPSADTIKALKYMRDRVGVPRDMKFPEARQLRAHLNWMLECVIQGSEQQ